MIDAYGSCLQCSSGVECRRRDAYIMRSVVICQREYYTSLFHEFCVLFISSFSMRLARLMSLLTMILYKFRLLASVVFKIECKRHWKTVLWCGLEDFSLFLFRTHFRTINRGLGFRLIGGWIFFYVTK